MTTKITMREVHDMVGHWLDTPANGYLGSTYGADAKSMLQKPLSDTSAADAFIAKLRNDVPILGIIPEDQVGLYHRSEGVDKKNIVLRLSGTSIEVGGGQ